MHNIVLIVAIKDLLISLNSRGMCRFRHPGIKTFRQMDTSQSLYTFRRNPCTSFYIEQLHTFPCDDRYATVQVNYYQYGSDNRGFGIRAHF